MASKLFNTRVGFYHTRQDSCSEYDVLYRGYIHHDDTYCLTRGLLSATRNNNTEKMKIQLRLLEERSPTWIDDFLSPDQSRSVLESALIHSSIVGDDCLRLLVAQQPKLMLLSNESTEQTALHAAVASQNVLAVEIYLGAMEALEAGGGLKRNLIDLPLKDNSKFCGTCFEAGSPLAMAAWNTQTDMLILLREHGARLDTINHRGDNLFHVLIKATQTEDHDSADRETVKTRQASLVRMFQQIVDMRFESEETTRLIPGMIGKRNKEGYTPLQLSAIQCCSAMFEIIVNCTNVYKFLNNVETGSISYLYDVTEVDSALTLSPRPSSALDLIMSDNSAHAQELFGFTRTHPITDMIQAKWKVYRYYYYSWACLHLVMMVAVSACCIYRHKEMQTTPNSYTEPGHYARAAIEVVFLLYALGLLGMEIFQVLYHRGLPHPFNPLGDGVYRLLLVIMGASTIVSTVFRFVAPRWETYALVGVVMNGWIFMIFFARAFEKFSYFTVMIQMAVFGDMARFMLVYFVILLGSAVGSILVFQPMSGAPITSHRFKHLGSSLFGLFEISAGFGELRSSETPDVALATAVVVFFILISNILLLNMLVALLSDTCSKVSTDKRSQWNLQKLSVILFIEKRLPRRFRHRCGHSRFAKQFGEEEQTAFPGSIGNPLIPQAYPSVKEERYYMEVKVTTP